jgi:sortase (surface protein transpeptidase)
VTLRGVVARRRVPILLAAGVGVVLLGGATIGLTAGHADAARPAPSRAADDRNAAGRILDPVPAPSSAPAATPVGLRIPQLGIDTAGLESLTTSASGRLQPPVAPDRAGWYSAGVAPGQIGPAIIAGHIDYSAGPGIFEHLDQLQKGSLVEVPMSDGATLRFRVTGSTESPKAQFPTSEVYGTVPDRQLRLICCAGAFDRATAHYRDNLIVFATLVTD